MRKIENGNFGLFPFLRKVQRDEIGQFAKILKSFILNIEVRFFDISASLNKKSTKKYLDYDQMVIEQGAPILDRVVCGVGPLLDVFYMKDALVNAHLNGPLADMGIGGEWGWFMRDVLSHRDDVVMAAGERLGRLSAREQDVRIVLGTPPTPSIIDSFRDLPREGFPLLRRLVIRLLTIMPTTFACEQSFSYLKKDSSQQHGRRNGQEFYHLASKSVQW